MDFALSDEQRLIKETARDFTDKEIVPRARDNDRNAHFDSDLVGRIADQGYLGALVAPEHGGAGLDYLSYGLIVEEIGRGDSSMRTVVSVQTWLVCFGLTEPDTGSDAANQRTRARRTDSGRVINGAKMWISMGNVAKLALIFAQTDPEKAHKGLACFLVETDGNDGYQPQEIHGKLGLHGSDTAAISLSDCAVGEGALLGQVGDGFKIAMTSLESGRYSVPAGCVGICQGCVDYCVDYAKERKQFGRPIASFQLVQGMLAT